MALPIIGTAPIRHSGGGSGAEDVMKIDFVPDDSGLLNSQSFNYEEGLYDGSLMGPSTARVIPHISLTSTNRDVRLRESTPDQVQWYCSNGAGNCFYFWKGDGVTTGYADNVSDPSAAWQMTLELYRLLVSNGYGIDLYFYGNDDLSSCYAITTNPYSNYTRILKRTPGQDYYWNGSAWTTSVVNLGSTAVYSSWHTWTITMRPGVSFDFATTRGTASDTNITEDLGLGSAGKPVCLLGAYLSGYTGELMWTREIHRDYI